MPTFEERYTAWVDGRLPANEAAAFERELESLESAEADRQEAHQLGALLRRCAVAPALPRGEDFQASLLRRMAEEDAETLPAVHERLAPELGWRSLPRLAWAAAICLLCSLGIYEGTKHFSEPGQPYVTKRQPVVMPEEAKPAALRSAGNGLVAARTKAPASPVEVRASETKAADPSIYASYVHSDEQGVTVVWLDGLDYLPASYQLQ